jgi:ubiquinone/menaquinone biosynthesis C-methylase UbiE
MVDGRKIAVADSIQSVYEEEEYSDREIEWREIAGKHKAENILSVCRTHEFNKVLECGAGDGSILQFLDNANLFQELSAIEISDNAINQIKNRKLTKLKDIRKFNGYEIPYGDKQFDMAYCSHVIEHVEHPRILLRELKRVSNYQVFEVPLDYLIDVDSKVELFLSYGHINIFTPSLFKFLLKSEGYLIVEELFSHMTDDVLRFNWYRNLKLKKSFGREFRLRIYPTLRFMKKTIFGNTNFREYEYQFYTCLAKGTDELTINTTGKKGR